MTISLREVTAANLNAVLNLKVKPEQTGFVATNARSIAQGHYDDKAWFRAIYADETPVGFVMLSIDTEKPEYYLWRFMIDADQQGKGYGYQALQTIIDYVRTLPNAKTLTLSHGEGEGSPEPFYKKFGFEHTGEVDGDELVMKLDL